MASLYECVRLRYEHWTFMNQFSPLFSVSSWKVALQDTCEYNRKGWCAYKSRHGHVAHRLDHHGGVHDGRHTHRPSASECANDKCVSNTKKACGQYTPYFHHTPYSRVHAHNTCMHAKVYPSHERVSTPFTPIKWWFVIRTHEHSHTPTYWQQNGVCPWWCLHVHTTGCMHSPRILFPNEYSILSSVCTRE